MTTVDLTAGYLLDLLFGDPQWLPHPVKAIGYGIAHLTNMVKKYASTASQEFIGGVIVWLLVVGGISTSVYFILHVASGAGNIPGHIVSIYFVYAVLATRSLHRESARVMGKLAKKDKNGARKALRCLVSRDTEQLSCVGILKALLETVSENIVDGIGAPFFYLAIGGPVLAWAYKASNTLDSMVGYKNEEFINLGKFSARADDVLNFFPARITGICMMLSSKILKLDYKNAWTIWKRDASKHPSPNAGIPEAVLAGALGIELGGPGRYFGGFVEKPFIGNARFQVSTTHYQEAIRLLYLTSLMLFFAVLLSTMIRK